MLDVETDEFTTCITFGLGQYTHYPSSSRHTSGSSCKKKVSRMGLLIVATSSILRLASPRLNQQMVFWERNLDN